MRLKNPAPARAFLSLGGAMGLAALLLVPGQFVTPDAGALPVLHAEPAERFQVEVLGYGETFGGVLSRSMIPMADQRELLLAFQEHASASRLRIGTEITLRYRRGQEALQGIDVGLNPDQVVRIERDAFGWRSAVLETPVWVDTIFVAGEITRDLWSAVVLNPALQEMPRADRALVVDLLDKVFQWQVDFSRQIQPGDRYRLAFEREVRPDGSMRGKGRVVVAELENRGRQLHAIWFDLHGDGIGGYYDRDGSSLRRAFLKAPLEFRRISSGFNLNRFHPILNVNRPHIGVDYAAATGTPVMATSDGTVTVRGVQGGYGNLVEIRHSGGFVSRYAHLNGFASGIRVGGRVSQGEVIGYVGMTGLATGPHLHYELHKDGRPVDPLNVDIPSGDPIPSSHMPRWAQESETRFALLSLAVVNRGVRVAEGAEVPEASGTADGSVNGATNGAANEGSARGSQ
jgi:murein DD-endopeptidase MepM/ murein hydrolase activator NlpD